MKQYGCGVFTLNNFLSDDECLYHQASHGEYQAADVRTLKGPKMMTHVRNNDRVIFTDHALASEWFGRIRTSLPQNIDSWSLSGINEQFRLYKYSPGQFFKWHKDGAYETSEESSFLTLMVYLNADFEGGDTEFRWDKIKPEAGMALVFPHGLFHQGATITNGVKYVLRTDIMYMKI